MPIILAVLASLLIGVTLQQTLQASQSVLKSNNVIANIYALNSVTLKAQEALASYAPTGNPAFLINYEQHHDEFWQIIDTIEQLEFRDDHNHDHEELENIESLFERWVTEVAQPQIALNQGNVTRNASILNQRYQQVLQLQNAELRYLLEPSEETLTHWQNTLSSLKQNSLTDFSTLPEHYRSDWQQFITQLDAYTLAMNTPLPRPLIPQGNTLESQLFALVTLNHELEQQLLGVVGNVDEHDLIASLLRETDVLIAEEAAFQLESLQLSSVALRRMNILAYVAPLLAVLLGFLLVFMNLRSMVGALRSLTVSANAFTLGHFDQRVDVKRADEIGFLAASFNAMAASIEARERQTKLLNEFGELLQACSNVDEAYKITGRLCKQLFPDATGALYIISSSRNVVERVAYWGDESLLNGSIFAPDDCWALRGGRLHVMQHGGVGCHHLPEQTPGVTLCIPLVSQDDTQGIFHLTSSSTDSDAWLTKQQLLAVTVSEQLSIAISNLRLREALRGLSIRDSLTGLYNRRYLEETLERELRRLERNHTTLCLLVFDVDHFKTFNDTFGHDAGDVVLKKLADLLKQNSRSSDIACRYGGEEFIVVLPDTTEAIALQRATSLHEQLQLLDVTYHEQSLGDITVSIGIAVAPEQGSTLEVLIRHADLALYQAKQTGRNKTVLASSLPELKNSETQ